MRGTEIAHLTDFQGGTSSPFPQIMGMALMKALCGHWSYLESYHEGLQEGNNFGGCPSLTPRFALLTQNQESYNTKHSIYLESMLMQCYGNYICKIAFVVL